MRVSPIRVLLPAGVCLAIFGLMIWHAQMLPSVVVHAQVSGGPPSVESARAAMIQAAENEKRHPTKKAALAADAALQDYNAAVAFRVEEIRVLLKELAKIEKAGKTTATLSQIQALETELRLILPLAGPTPTTTPETEPNNTSGTANTLDVSATVEPCAIVSGAINPGGDIDFFTFTGAPAGSRIWIETDTGGTQNVGATSRDTVIDLLAADGTTVIENDDDDGTGNGGDGTVETGLASMIGGRTLTAGGTYFIRVRAFSGTAIVDPYRLFVVLTNTAATAEVEANDTAATANVIVATGGSVGLRSGSIGVAADVDYYSVDATAGNIVYFNTDADPERDGTGTDLVVEFRDPSDVLLLSIDSSITGSLANPAAEGANFTISTSGVYFIKVRHFSAVGTGTYHLMVSTCSGGGGGGCTSLTCPANVTQSNDPNQCGAVTTYPAPTSVGSCGTITCSPASGSFFPVGTTTVTCTSTAGPTCSFTVTINDTQPPTITCPGNVTVIGAPGSPTVVVTYAAPTASDNCPGVTAVCSPPSGSSVPVGTTTVTCTATDGSSNTATCSFTVNAFDGRLQDNSAGCNSAVIFSSVSGAYSFCCGGTVYTGTGKVTKKGNSITIEENSPGRRVLIKLDNSAHAGSASLQSPPGTTKCTVSDSNTTNDTCTCP